MRTFLNILSASFAAMRIPGPPSRLDRVLGFARLRWALRHFEASHSDWRKESFCGLRLQFQEPRTFVYLLEEIFMRGSYRFRAQRDDPLMLDVGANIGLASLHFLTRYPRGRVVAIEPNPAAVALLSENLKENGWGGMEIHPVAVGEDQGEGFLEFPSSRPTSVGAAITEGGESGEGVTVPVVPFSSIIPERVDFLKLDVEGSEERCLQEAAQAGALHRIDEIVVECHQDLFDGLDAQDVARRVGTLLSENGFRTWVVGQPEKDMDGRIAAVLLRARREGRD